MIRLVCICGKHLRARDEASLRNAVCPSCGCPVSKAATRNSDDPTLAQRPLTMKDGPFDGMGYVLVPLWEEGKPLSREVPRYKVVLVEESEFPAAIPYRAEDTAPVPVMPLHRDRKRRKRRRSRELDTRLEETLLFPFYCRQSVVALALLLAFFVIVGRAVLASPEVLLAKVILALVPLLLSACYCCAFWMVAFATTLRGEDSVVAHDGMTSVAVMAALLRCLLCFFAGPVWLLAIAFYYWLHCGNLTPVDYVILAELALAALLYWIFANLAVTADNSLRGLLPTGIAALLRRLGWKRSLRTLAALVLAILLNGGLGIYAVATMSESGWSWFLLFASCLGTQFSLALLARWLGVAMFLSARARQPQPQENRTAAIAGKTLS
jgi:hypothetical protein